MGFHLLVPDWLHQWEGRDLCLVSLVTLWTKLGLILSSDITFQRNTETTTPSYPPRCNDHEVQRVSPRMRVQAQGVCVVVGNACWACCRQAFGHRPFGA